MSAERTITGWAGELLDEKLAGLTLCEGVTTGSALDGGFMSGEVTIGERKGKSYPIYSLEVEVPWSGTIGGKECSGKVHLPDVSLEMLEDLEVRPPSPPPGLLRSAPLAPPVWWRERAGCGEAAAARAAYVRRSAA